MTATDRAIADATDSVRSHVEDQWERSVLPTLQDYIAIPCVSAAYDPQWVEHGHMAEAVAMVTAWCRERDIAGLTVEVAELPGRTPMIVAEVPASGGGPADDTVLLYGHIDKQPEMTGWRAGLGPWTPVIEGDRLYGRGGADDGYAGFASLLAIEAVQRAGLPHARCIVLIEASEESGSPDLPAHLDALLGRIGTPSLVLCLDSGCVDDSRMWATTNLRGLASGVLRVDVLEHGIHSGEGSGVVASSFRILRQLLDRVEDRGAGEILLPELHVEVPADRLAQARETASVDVPARAIPFVPGMRPVHEDAVEQILDQTWRPTMSVVGVDGIPSLANGGNVLRPTTAVSLSFRLPPTCDAAAALAAIERAVTADPPYGARVTFTDTRHADGWNAPSFAPWLEEALEGTSAGTFGQPFGAMGEGGTIPFMGMLSTMFPDAQFLVTGALGPGSNAHGPDEFLPLPTARRRTALLALLLGRHAQRPR